MTLIKAVIRSLTSLLTTIVWNTYSIKIDTTSDVSRACFVCYDPDTWVKPVSDLKRMVKKNPAVQELIDRMELVEVESDNNFNQMIN